MLRLPIGIPVIRLSLLAVLREHAHLPPPLLHGLHLLVVSQTHGRPVPGGRPANGGCAALDRAVGGGVTFPLAEERALPRLRSAADLLQDAFGCLARSLLDL